MTQHPALRPLALALALAAPATAALAAPGSSSPYRRDAQYTHVEDATSRGINQVNMISCVMSAMRPDALVNQGNYTALVDEGKCNPESRASSDNASSSSSGTSAPSYMKSVVRATRTTNSEPMRVRTWIDMSEGGEEMTIFVNIAASEAPSTTNPYGDFRLDYCGKGTSGPCMMRGYLAGSSSGISYFEIESGGGGGGGSQTKALRLTASGSDSGAGALQFSEQGQTVAYSFAYNSTHFRRSDGTADQCFTRDASDSGTGMSVWRYGLYDAENGERVDVRSGFPIEYTAPNNTRYNGHMGYWGLWLPPEAQAQINNGDTVQRVEYNPNAAPTKTDYTLLKADGRLTRYTKRTRTLASTDGIRFNAFIGNATGFFSGAQSFTQYEMYWDNTAGNFKVTAMMDCSQNGCQTRSLDTVQTVAASYFATQGGVRGWSQALGGDVFIPITGGSLDASTVTVIYRVRDLVYPADLPATLYCLNNCPTSASMSNFFNSQTGSSPYVGATYNNWQPTAASGVITYTTSSTSAVLRDGTNAAVTFTNAQALESQPQYRQGVRTGRLFTSLASAQCDVNPSLYCDNKIHELDVYYEWETGPNQWNQFAALRDGNNNVVSFDPPLQVSYSVPSGAQYGAYAGKSIVLEYGGFGQLWGIPGSCVSRFTNEAVSCDQPESRYVPAFVIPFDETLGRVTRNSTPMLAKWLDREIRFARKPLSACTNAGLSLPTGLTLPSATGLADPSDSTSDIYIGSKPSVTDAPRVIHGEVMY
jgi:hypothetical protein